MCLNKYNIRLRGIVFTSEINLYHNPDSGSTIFLIRNIYYLDDLAERFVQLRVAQRRELIHYKHWSLSYDICLIFALSPLFFIFFPLNPYIFPVRQTPKNMLVKLYFSLHFIPLNPDPRTKMNADPTGSEFGFTSLLKSNCTTVFMPARGRGGWPARRRGSYAPVSSAASRSWSQFHDFPAKKQ